MSNFNSATNILKPSWDSRMFGSSSTLGVDEKSDVTSAEGMPRSGRPRVFVVDDEPVIAKTLAAILENAGFATEAFTDPLDALRVAGLRYPDIMISDVMMPQMNGIDLAVQVRAIYPECRILLFSGQAATSDLLRDANNNGYHFDILSKPVHPKDLLAALQPSTVSLDSNS